MDGPHLPPPRRAAHEEPFVPGTLEPLRDFGNLTLECKRSVACVNREARGIFTEHLRQRRLHVDCRDCTLSNARFVTDRLMTVVDDLLLVSKWEQLCPVLPLAQIKYEPRVRLKSKEGIEINPTTAFFLGHVMAGKDCIVRLTTGKTKRLLSLSENPQVYLSHEDTHKDADRRVMAPSLHQNALRRIRACNGENLILANLYMDNEALLAIAHEFRTLAGTLKSLDLSGNAFGAAGLCALFRNPGTLPPMLQLKTLCLSGTMLRSEGASVLANVFAEKQLPVLENLLLSKMRIGNDGVECLAPHLRHLAHLKLLDLSGNTFGDKAIASLLQPDRLPLPELLLLNLINCRYVTVSAFKALAIAVCEGRFPKLQDLCVNKQGSHSALRKALKVLEATRAWKELYINDPVLQRNMEEARKHCLSFNVRRHQSPPQPQLV